MNNQIKQQLGRSVATISAVIADEALIERVIQASKLTAAAMKNGHKLLVAGNGGSAADAQHTVAEFVSRLTVDRPAMPAIALTTDTSILTAIGNDYSYDKVFERQVEALGQKGDVFLGISTSGNSRNVINALKRCREREIVTIGYIGGGGSAMAPLCDVAVMVPSQITMHIQEAHLALEHAFCMAVEHYYFSNALLMGDGAQGNS